MLGSDTVAPTYVETDTCSTFPATSSTPFVPVSPSSSAFSPLAAAFFFFFFDDLDGAFVDAAVRISIPVSVTSIVSSN